MAIAFGFEDASLDEIVSFTVPANRRSVAVMKRLGMTYVGEFDHPRLPERTPASQTCALPSVSSLTASDIAAHSGMQPSFG